MLSGADEEYSGVVETLACWVVLEGVGRAPSTLKFSLDVLTRVMPCFLEELVDKIKLQPKEPL
jgi:hypothetical protein